MIILIGEGASGKTTILNELEKKGYKKAINYTTRVPREEENLLNEYRFIKKEEFETLWNEGKLLQKNEFNEEWYGIDLSSIEKESAFISIKDSIQDIKDKLKVIGKLDLNPICFYIHVSPEERTKRMLKRGDSLDYIQKRVAIDKEIFKQVDLVADYIVENIELEKTVEKIINLYKNTNQKEAI